MTPLQETRERLGLTVKDLAGITGLNYSSVYNAERGYTTGRICGKLRAGLESIGVDADDLERRQRDWVQNESLRLRKALMERPCSTT